MKNIIILSVLAALFFCESANAQAPSWQWAVQSFSPAAFSSLIPLQMCNDALGNIFIAGKASHDLFVAGGQLQSDTNRALSTFLVKYNSEGKALWVRQVKDSADYPVAGLALDSSGNSYIFALARTNVNLGNGDVLGFGAYIAKYDSSGNMKEAKHISNQYINPYAMAIDKFGNMYVTGSFHDTTDFQNGKLIDSAGGSIFLAKLDNSGNVLWAKGFGGANRNSYCFGSSLSVISDVESSTIYLIGALSSDSTYFDNTLIINNSGKAGYCPFLARCNGQGTVEWIRTGSDHYNGSYNSGIAWGICTDHSGKIYVTGSFDADSGFFDDPAIHTDRTGNAFIEKFNSSGASEWIRVNSTVLGISQNAGISGNGIAVDREGNVYTCGTFTGAINFSGENYEASYWMYNNAYVMSFDSAGKKNWFQTSQANNGTAGSASIALYNGYPYISGRYSNSLSFGNTINLLPDSTGQQIFYLAKLGNTPASVHSFLNSSKNSLTIFPNPASSHVSINFISDNSGNTSLKIYDLLGRPMKEVSLGMTEAGEHSQEVDLSGLSGGSYLCKLQTGSEVTSAIVTILK